VLGLQLYELAPLATKVTAFPEQIVGLEGIIEIGLPAVVVIDTSAVDEHPLASVPVTV
jgi:hypothetical protein